MSRGSAFERLGADECRQLLGSRTFGRVCLGVADEVRVNLTTYVARSDRIYFRATTFGPVARHIRTRPVTLQVDDMTSDHQAGWSVTVTGEAHVVEDAATLASLWSPVRPAPWHVAREPRWVALTPDHVRGERLRPQSVSDRPARP